MNRCPQCGGAIDAIYDLRQVSIRNSPNPLLRYSGLLPVAREENLLWLGEGNTPCIHAKQLGAALGLKHLYLKDESANPSRSTKDRIGSVGLSYFKDLGVSEFVIASTGNSSTAYARAVQLVDGFRVHIFVGEDFLPRLNYPDHPSVSTYVVRDDFVNAGGAAKEFADSKKLFFEGGFFSLARREGLKLAYLEAFDAMPQPPEYVFQAVSSGMGLLGAYKGALEYRALGRLPVLPRFVAVQQRSCSPMASAFGEKSIAIRGHHIVRNPKGLAYAILRGDPSQSYPYIRYLTQRSGGQILSVDDAAIIEARRLALEAEGCSICYASATALAGLIHQARSGAIDPQAPILVNLTGADRPNSPVPGRVERFERRQAATA
jgi:threonine synthase